MALALQDRLLTAIVSVTLTSAAWIVAESGVRFSSSAPVAGTAAAPLVAPPASAPVTVAAGEWAIPVAGVRAGQLRDSFTEARGGGTRSHEAIDIMAPRGTPVLAAAAGTVERLWVSKDGGNTIYVRSQDRRTIHYYAHLDTWTPGLAEGDTVVRGEQLGEVGSTGNATTPHLHFAILRTRAAAKWWEPATAINPYPLLAGH